MIFASCVFAQNVSRIFGGNCPSYPVFCLQKILRGLVHFVILSAEGEGPEGYV